MIRDNFKTSLHRELSSRFPFLKSMKNYFNLYTRKNLGLVYFQRKDFNNLQALRDISPLYVREMSTNDEFQIIEWLNIINQSFSRNWKKKDFVKNIINHEVYNVLHTYFLIDNERYIGVVSEAVFKKNNKFGVTHYLGLNRDYLGRGLGKYLILYTLHKMKEHNLMNCEGESTLDYKKSLFIHFDLGFLPKTKLDYWNTPNHIHGLTRFIINYKFNNLFQKWKRKKAR